MTAMKVVLIEDEPDIQFLLGAVLQRDRDLDVVSVTSGFDRALEPEFWRDVDVAVVDLMLPGVLGVDILHAARAYRPHCRLIVWSALSPGLISQEVHRLADRVMEKTDSPFDLIAAIKGR